MSRTPSGGTSSHFNSHGASCTEVLLKDTPTAVCRVETMALTIGEGTIISEGVVLQGHTVERLAATFVPTTCATCTAPQRLRTQIGKLSHCAASACPVLNRSPSVKCLSSGFAR